jgi:polycomb protein EED
VRLLQFHLPGCHEFYMRFSLSAPLSTGATHSILAMCNSCAKVFFWDLARLTEYHDYTASAIGSDMDGIQPQSAPPHWLIAHAKSGRFRTIEPSPAAPASTSTPTPISETFPGNSLELSASAKRKYGMGSPLEMLEAHKILTLHKFRANGQQLAWSVCGKWCVVAAVPNAIVVLKMGSEKRG